jgi:hypothetical protein
MQMGNGAFNLCLSPNIVTKVDPNNFNQLIRTNIFDDGTNVGVHTVTPVYEFQVDRPSMLSMSDLTADRQQ